MKILHTVQLYHPRVGGSEEVVKQLSERLAKRGHDVTVATRPERTRTTRTINGVTIAEFDISGNAVNGIRGDAIAYREFLLKGNFDVMLNYAAQIWSTDLVFPLLSRIPYKKVLVPCGYSSLHHPKYRQYFTELPTYLQQYNRIVYLSHNYQDKSFGDAHGITKSIVIPNAASENEFSSQHQGFRKKYEITSPFMLLTIANHYPTKGHQFVIDAWRALKRDDVTLVIIGDNPSSFPYSDSCYPRCRWQTLRHKNLTLLSGVPRPDVVSALQEADVFVFGSSVECSPLVIFEAMAATTPFVTTNCGSVADLKEFGYIVQTRQEMSTVVAKLLANERERKEEGRRAHEEWRQHYTWEHIIDQYEEMYHELVT